MYFNNVKIGRVSSPIVISDDEDVQVLENINNEENIIDVENNDDQREPSPEVLDIDFNEVPLQEGDLEMHNLLNNDLNEMEIEGVEEDNGANETDGSDDGYSSGFEEEADQEADQEEGQEEAHPILFLHFIQNLENDLHHHLNVKINCYRHKIYLLRRKRDRAIRKIKRRLRRIREIRIEEERLQRNQGRVRRFIPLDMPKRGQDVCWGCGKKFWLQRIRRWGRCEECSLWLCPDCFALSPHCQDFEL